MRIIEDETALQNFLLKLQKRSISFSKKAEKSVKKILTDVQRNGDSAVQRYTELYDKHKFLRLEKKEIKSYAQKTDHKVIEALQLSASRIREYHEKQKESSWMITKNGAVLGQIIKPLERVGIYIPGGKASYPSTVLMNVIPAQVAGVSEIVICTPTPQGEINSALMAAIEMLDIEEVYRIGGAQAIGAMAYGTESIKRVDKIVGPGNIYVSIAKKLVFGVVDIDMIAGPSEIVIVADESANPEFIAADLLSQAEHDEMASSILISDSDFLLKRVLSEIKSQIETLERINIAKESLKRYGALIKTATIEDALKIVNEIAPEHLEIITKNPQENVKCVKNAGAIFIGPWTPEPLGDYSAGPNHTLPTCGTARFSSPLGVYDFIKRISFLQFDYESFSRIADVVDTLAMAEGLDAHAKTIRIRKKLMNT